MFKKISEAIGEKINDFKAPSTPKSTPVKVSSSSLPARISYATQPQTTYSEISVYRPTIPNTPEELARFMEQPPYLVALLNSIKSEKARAFLKSSCELVDKILKHQNGDIHLEDHKISLYRDQISNNLLAVKIEENTPSVSVFQAPSLKQTIPEKVSSHTPPEKKWCPAKPRAVSENIIYEVTMSKTVEGFAAIVDKPSHFNALLLNCKNTVASDLIKAGNCLKDFQARSEQMEAIERNETYCKLQKVLEFLAEIHISKNRLGIEESKPSISNFQARLNQTIPEKVSLYTSPEKNTIPSQSTSY